MPSVIFSSKYITQTLRLVGGGGGTVCKTNFSPLQPSVWYKNEGGPGPPGPSSASATGLYVSFLFSSVKIEGDVKEPTTYYWSKRVGDLCRWCGLPFTYRTSFISWAVGGLQYYGLIVAPCAPKSELNVKEGASCCPLIHDITLHYNNNIIGDELLLNFGAKFQR